jgi:multiple sugar transport system permease protein
MTTQTLSPVQKHKSRQHSGNTLAYIVMSVFLAYFLIPLLWLFISSTKTNAGLFTSFGLWFDKTINITQNLKALFARDNSSFGLWLRNTAVYAINAALFSTLISAMAGYAFAQYHFKGRGILFGIVLASVFVPGTAFAVPLYLLESKTGLTNSLLAVILPALVNPFGVYLMRIYTETAVSQDLIDAARVDGAGEFRIFATIVFRLIAPGFVTVFLFAFVGAWNNYFLPLLVLGKMNLYPLTVGLAYWNGLTILPGNSHVLYILVIMGSVVAILPLMIVFLFLQRFWQEGLSLGSLKG